MDSDEHLSLNLSDLSLLDCSICFNPLTIPIFQCGNGHVTCSSCHPKLKNKCPTCSTILGNSRNRALEKLLESLKISCAHKSSGCTALLPYSSKRSHEETCSYAPYRCPFKDCNNSGSPAELYLHLKQDHSTIPLKPNGSSFGKFSMSKSDEFVVFLQEEGDGNESCGSVYVLDYRAMRIRCINDEDAEVKQRFTMAVQHNCGTFLFEPDVTPWMTADAVASDSANDKLLGFLDQFFDDDGLLWLRVLN